MIFFSCCRLQLLGRMTVDFRNDISGENVRMESHDPLINLPVEITDRR